MSPNPKTKTFRSKKACEWFRDQPCFISMILGVWDYGIQKTGHHETLNGKGTSLKGPDDEQVSLTLDFHMERERTCRETFWKKYEQYMKAYGLNNWREVVKDYRIKVNQYLKDNGYKWNKEVLK